MISSMPLLILIQMTMAHAHQGHPRPCTQDELACGFKERWFNGRIDRVMCYPPDQRQIYAGDCSVEEQEECTFLNLQKDDSLGQ